jgi:hypothetical protein
MNHIVKFSSDRNGITIKQLTVSEALARIPEVQFDDAIQDIVMELDISSTEYSEQLKTIKGSLHWLVNRALWALEGVTIVADPEDEEAA